MRTILITKPDPHLLQKIEAACRGGIDAVQLRDKEAEGFDLFHLAKKLREITWNYGASFFINSRIDIALAVKADGVHLPENSLSPRLVKMHNLQAGASVHSLAAAQRAKQEGADFLFFSPIFDTPGKGAAVGLESLREVASNLSLPVYALGGVTPERIPSLKQAGAFGIAAISAILDAPDVEAAARAFRSHFPRKKFQFQGILGLVSDFAMAKFAIDNGVDGIQFRFKGQYTQEAFDIAKRVCSLCSAAAIPFFINDRSDIAKLLNALGVHLGQTDLPIQDARRLLGPDPIIGITASNVEEALAAQEAGADYIGLGHVFPTRSKLKLTPPIGLEMVRRVKAQIQIPLIAIGGIDENNAASVFEAGADGIAVISSLPKIQELRNVCRC